MSRITAEEIEDGARVGLDVADPEACRIRINLDAIVDSVNDEGRLTAAGMEATRLELTGAMRNRLESLAWAAREPAIMASPIERPLFLTGLPRSGTTFFQYLFDVDPDLRLIRTWESRSPSPPPALDKAAAARRLDETRRDVEARRRSLEGWDAVHLVDPDGPDECHNLLTQTFCQAGFLNYLNVPTYFDRLLDTLDHRVAFEVHKRQLQVLQYGSAPKRWTLKYPNHVLDMPVILEGYPDARFVMTHRDPVQTLSSLCKLTLMLRGERSDTVDAKEIGRQMRYFVRKHIDGIMDFADTPLGHERIVHVDYYRLTEDPASVLADVYDDLGMTMPTEVHSGVIEWHRRNPKGKRGRNDYSIQAFGLDAGEVAEEYGDYIARFDIPREGAVVQPVPA